MAIIILNIDPVIRAPAERMLQLAQRHHPGLGGGGIDIAVLVVLGPTGPLTALPARAALVVVTDRPALPQAAAALLLGARAYLPLDQSPAQVANALHQVAHGHLPLEPETAAILRSLAHLGGGLHPHLRAGDIATALSLCAHGWTWPEAIQSAGSDPIDTEQWLLSLLTTRQSQEGHLTPTGR